MSLSGVFLRLAWQTTEYELAESAEKYKEALMFKLGKDISEWRDTYEVIVRPF